MNRASRLVVSALSALLALPAAATTYKMVSDPVLADQAAAVAEVRVSSVEPAPVDGRPATDYLVEVQRLLKGNLPGSTVVVRVPGGVRPDGIGLKVFGAPEFYEGETAILFLRPAQDGTYRILHLMLGAFHRRYVGGRSIAVRDLSDAFEVGPTGVEERLDAMRDFHRFSEWVSDRGEGNRRESDYVLDSAPEGVGQVTEPFTLMKSDSGTAIRWFEFDSGQPISWRVHASGQPGLGQQASIQAFRVAMEAWNSDPGSNVRYGYVGTTTSTAGFDHDDGVNAILFDDPRRNDAEGTFSCASGGVIAVGGPYFNTSTRGFGGKSWHQAVEADIVTNDGTECYFRDNPRVAEEVFAHELGHTLGIGHSATWDALMYSRAHDDGRGASLGADDRAAVASLYPAGGSGGTNPAVLTAPSRLAAKVLSRSQVRLTWLDNSTGEKSFRIEAKLRGGRFQEVLALPAGATSAVIGGLRPGKVYVFRVRAAGPSGLSAYSNTARAATPGQ